MFWKNTNFALILHYISLILLFESLFMLSAAAIAAGYREPILSGMLGAALVTFSVGLLFYFLTRKFRNQEPGRRESLLIVSAGWFFLGFFGTLPYLLTGTIPHVANALFESVSGFSTTGSSILTDVEAMPKSILFWRSETHWIGGIGIIVMVIAIMPFLKVSGIQLFGSEASIVVEERIVPKMRYVARNFGIIYVGFTVAQTLLMWIAGMPLFDSVCHSFGTVATGGFSTQNDSIAGYSPVIQYIVTFFMLIAGMNFSLHFLLFTGRGRQMWKNEEWRFYLIIIFGVVALLTVTLFLKMGMPLEAAFRDASFQVVTIITATGFATDDYLLWPIYGQLLIAMLMLIGASAGSTGGGVKVIRHLVALKKIRHSFRRLIYPNAVSHVRYNGRVLDAEQVSGIIGFIIFYYLILVGGILFLMAVGLDAATSFGSVATTMAGIGPGFGTVGPVSNFAHLPDVAKYFLCLTMILGRLEIYPVVILFTPWFWKA